MKTLKKLALFLIFVPQMVFASSGEKINLKDKSQLHINLVNQNCKTKHTMDEGGAVNMFGYTFYFNEKFILKAMFNKEDGSSSVGLVGSKGSLLVVTTLFETETDIDFKDLSLLISNLPLLTSNVVAKKQKKIINFVLSGDENILNQGENIADLIHLEKKMRSRKQESNIYGPLNTNKKGFFRISIKPSLACNFYVTSKL